MKAESPNKWKFARMDLVALAVAAVIALLFYWAGVRPVLSLNERRAAQNEQVKELRGKGAAAADHADKLKNTLAAIQAALREIPVQLEPASTVNNKIGRLAKLATDQGLKVDEIHPALSPRYSRDYGSVDISLTGKGAYRNWASFLHDLSKSSPDTAVDTFELTAPSAANATGLEFRVNLVWYVTPLPALAQK